MRLKGGPNIAALCWAKGLWHPQPLGRISLLNPWETLRLSRLATNGSPGGLCPRPQYFRGAVGEEGA